MYSIQILTTVASFLATATVAFPPKDSHGKFDHDNGQMTVEQAGNQCGNHQTLACCNSKSFSNSGEGNILGSLGLNQLLGGNCQTITVPVLAAPINHPQACGNNVAACCEKSEQTGAINVNAQCNPIDLGIL